MDRLRRQPRRAAQITSSDPGELFEVRNIANVVPPADAYDDAVGAAIEYGVGHLGIDDIVVCGHTGCGGIAALLEPIPPDREAHLGRWVEFTKPAHQLVAAAQVPEAERLTATIKAHVQFQLDNLMTYPIVREGVASGRVNIHGWMYDMENGTLTAYDPQTGEWRGPPRQGLSPAARSRRAACSPCDKILLRLESEAAAPPFGHIARQHALLGMWAKHVTLGLRLRTTGSAGRKAPPFRPPACRAHPTSRIKK